MGVRVPRMLTNESLLKKNFCHGREPLPYGSCKMEPPQRPHGSKVELVTITWFQSIEAARAFAGEDYEKAAVPRKTRE